MMTYEKEANAFPARGISNIRVCGTLDIGSCGFDLGQQPTAWFVAAPLNKIRLNNGYKRQALARPSSPNDKKSCHQRSTVID